MFGKPEWFGEQRIGWGLRPKAWQGWVYAAAWMGAIGMPFIGLISRRQGPEALFWLVVSTGLLLWDIAGIRKGVRSSSDADVLYIGEEGECCQNQLASRKFHFQLRK